MQENIQIVNRVLDIIETLAEAPSPMGPTKLAEATGLSKSTVHRLLASLHSRNYVEKDIVNGKYSIGPKLIEVVSCYINSLELQTEARPYLSKLTYDLNLTCHLGILDGHEVIYIEKLDAVAPMKLYSNVGFRVPAYCSSLGKCLLSCLSGEELTNAMENCKFEAFTPKTITNLKNLQIHLRQVRNQGWAMDDGEYDPNHRCIAAPIYDYRGDMIAAISVSGNITNLSDARIDSVRKEVLIAAGQISKRLGYIS